MSEMLAEGAKCSWCSHELDCEEREFPRTDADEDPICDNCHHQEYEFTCCNCEEYEDDEMQHKLLVVFTATSASHGDEVQPGIYNITGGPYWGTDYFSSWLYVEKLVWLCSLPESLQDDDPYYPVGHLCGDCQKEMQVRSVQEVTRKCAMAFS